MTRAAPIGVAGAALCRLGATPAADQVIVCIVCCASEQRLCPASAGAFSCESRPIVLGGPAGRAALCQLERLEDTTPTQEVCASLCRRATACRLYLAIWEIGGSEGGVGVGATYAGERSRLMRKPLPPPFSAGMSAVTSGRFPAFTQHRLLVGLLHGRDFRCQGFRC